MDRHADASLRAQRMRPRRLALATAFGTLFALAGCDRNSAWYGTTHPKHGTDTFWFNNYTEPEWIDPGKCSDNPGGTIINNIFEGLTQPNPHDLSPEPGVATSWEKSADKRTWTFHLRPNAKWSDGVPVTADDFVYSWTRVLDPAIDSKYADQLFDIQNGEPFNQKALHVTGLSGDEAAIRAQFEKFGTVAKVKTNAGPGGGVFVYFADKKGATPADAARREAIAAPWPSGTHVAVTGPEVLALSAPDPLTFVVTLENPVSYFLPKITTLYTFYPVPRHVIEKLIAEKKNPDLWTRAENIVSNGPYVLTDWKFRQELLFAPNPFYWDRASLKLTHVKVLEIESYTTALQMYKAGEIDWIGEQSDIPSEYSDYLRTKKDYRISPYLGTYWYWVNLKDPVMGKDPRIRHALDMALDKKAIVDHVTRQSQPVANSVVPDGLAGFHTLSTNHYDPEAAKRLLAEAGITDPSTLVVTLTYNTSETHKAIAEAMQEMWRKNLGIDARLHNEEWQVFLRDLETGNLQMGRLGWIGDYPDPFSFLSIFQSASGNNHAGFKSPEFDRLLAESALQTDDAKRIEYLERAEKILDDELPMIPIYFYTRHYLCKPYVKGLYNTFQDRHPWKAIWIDPNAADDGTAENGT